MGQLKSGHEQTARRRLSAYVILGAIAASVLQGKNPLRRTHPLRRARGQDLIAAKAGW